MFVVDRNGHGTVILHRMSDEHAYEAGSKKETATQRVDYATKVEPPNPLIHAKSMRCMLKQ